MKNLILFSNKHAPKTGYSLGKTLEISGLFWEEEGKLKRQKKCESPGKTMRVGWSANQVNTRLDGPKGTLAKLNEIYLIYFFSFGPSDLVFLIILFFKSKNL